jgi:hypothetical protein
LELHTLLQLRQTPRRDKLFNSSRNILQRQSVAHFLDRTIIFKKPRINHFSNRPRGKELDKNNNSSMVKSSQANKSRKGLKVNQQNVDTRFTKGSSADHVATCQNYFTYFSLNRGYFSTSSFLFLAFKQPSPLPKKV